MKEQFKHDPTTKAELAIEGVFIMFLGALFFLLMGVIYVATH